VQKRLVTISNDNPHWLTFTIDGRYCLRGGRQRKEPGDGRRRYCDLPANWIPRAIEDVLEVDFKTDKSRRRGVSWAWAECNNEIPYIRDRALLKQSMKSAKMFG